MTAEGRETAPPERSPPADTEHGLLPWWLLAAFATVALLAATGRLPEPAAATALTVVIAAATLRHPGNGLAALVLATPFLLGEPKTPYFLLEPLLVGLVLLGVLAHRLLGRQPLAAPYGRLLLGFLAAAVVALPLDLRDLLEDLWLAGSLDWPLMLAQGVPDVAHLKYLDRIVVTALGAGLFAAAAQPALGRGVVRTLPPLAGVVLAVAAFGLLRFFGWVRTAGRYLTLSFATWQNPDLRLTAVAWNPDYLALFLVLVLPPLAALAIVPGAGPWTRGLMGAAAAAGSLALVFTFQRAAYLAVLVAVATLAVLLGHARPGLRGRAATGLAGGVLVAGGVAVVIDAVLLGGRVTGRLARLTDDPNRVRLWQTAARMALAHPLLGIGTGRYAFFFPEYARELATGFGPFWGTAHSLYLHVAAEQGLVGLGCLGALFGSVWLGSARRLRAIPAPYSVVLAGVLAALAGWLAYGVVQFTFRVNALFYLACILAGTAAALAPPTARTGGRFRTTFLALAVGLSLLGLRAGDALRRPVSPGYEAGFHRWERQPEGGAARWTRGRAAVSVPVRGAVMALRFRAPIPGVADRPQSVRVWVDGRPAGPLRLTGPEWRRVDVRLPEPRPAHALVEVEVDYTFVPSRTAPPSRDDRRLGVLMGEIAWPGG